MYELGEPTLATPEGISCDYRMPYPDQTHDLHILVVSFSGAYPRGSLGDAHGAYIAVTAMHGLHAFEPDCIVLDFRLLEYQRGNGLRRVFEDIRHFMDCGRETSVPPFPIVVVTSDLCGDAIESLLSTLWGVSIDTLTTDIDEAIEAGVELARNWLDA